MDLPEWWSELIVDRVIAACNGVVFAQGRAGTPRATTRFSRRRIAEWWGGIDAEGGKGYNFIRLCKIFFESSDQIHGACSFRASVNPPEGGGVGNEYSNIGEAWRQIV